MHTEASSDTCRTDKKIHEVASVCFQFRKLVANDEKMRQSFKICTISPYSGIDPEVYGGIDGTVYPRPRTFVLGLKFNF